MRRGWSGHPRWPCPATPTSASAVPGTDWNPPCAASGPTVVHLASPAVLGAQAADVARRPSVAAVAVYQTDLAGFAARYGWRIAQEPAWRWLPYPWACAAIRCASWGVQKLLIKSPPN